MWLTRCTNRHTYTQTDRQTENTKLNGLSQAMFQLQSISVCGQTQTNLVGQIYCTLFSLGESVRICNDVIISNKWPTTSNTYFELYKSQIVDPQYNKQYIILTIQEIEMISHKYCEKKIYSGNNIHIIISAHHNHSILTPMRCPAQNHPATERSINIMCIVYCNITVQH